jgi:hypothetical protein
MMNSRDWENGARERPQRSRAELGVATGEECHRKKLAIAIVVLLAGALTLPNHEALARGGGGFGGGHGGGFNGAGSHDGALRRGFHGGDLGGGGNRQGGFSSRGSSHLAGGRVFDHRGQVGDPYWTPCNYDSYGTDSCE